MGTGFPLRLKRARKSHGFTQAEVAKELMTNHQNISRYETGITEPDMETLSQLAAFYGVSIDWLIGHGDSPGKEPISKWDGQTLKSSSFPEKLKTARKKSGLSQEKVAKILKIPRSTIAKYELGQLQPSLTTLLALTVFYGVTSDWLLGLTEDNPTI